MPEGLPDWYGAQGYMLTTIFAMKIKRYVDFNISDLSLNVSEKSFANAEHAGMPGGAILLHEEIMESPMVNDPLRKYMFCSPAEGGVALILASEKKAREIGAPFIKPDAPICAAHRVV